jgi:hypothetical protein
MDGWAMIGPTTALFANSLCPIGMSRRRARENKEKWWSDHFDDYGSWLSAGSAGEMARQRGLDQVGFYQKFLTHPAYDSFWQEQALDKLLAKPSDYQKASIKVFDAGGSASFIELPVVKSKSGAR